MRKPTDSQIINDIQGLLRREFGSTSGFLKALLARIGVWIPSDAAFVALARLEDDHAALAVWAPSGHPVGAATGRFASHPRLLRIGGADLPAAQRSFVGHVAHRRKAKRSSDVARSRFYLPLRRDTVSELAVPVSHGGALLGVVNLESQRKCAFSERDEQLLTLIVRMIAPQLADLLDREPIRQRAVLASRRDEAHRGANLLAWLTEMLRSGELRPALQSGVSRLAARFQARGCSIFIVDEPSGRLVLAASNRLRNLVGKASYDSGEGLTGWVAKHGQALCLATRSKDELGKIAVDLRWKAKFEEGGRRRDLRAAPFLAVPIVDDGTPYGVIRLSERVKPGVFSSSDTALLSAIGDHIAAVITQRKRLAAQRALRRAFHQLSEDFPTMDERGEYIADAAGLAPALDQVRNVLNADVLTYYPLEQTPEGDRFVTPPITAGVLRFPELMDHGLAPTDAPWLALRRQRCYWTNVGTVQELSVRRHDGHGSERDRFCVREGIISTAAICLAVGGVPAGVLFVNFRSRQRFPRKQQEMIETVADPLAMAAELARVRGRIRAVASRDGARRLWCELHTTVLGVLTAGALTSTDQAAKQIKAGRHDSALDHIYATDRAIRHVVDELRALAASGYVGPHTSDFRAGVRSGRLWKGPDRDSGLLAALQEARRSAWTGLGITVALPSRDVRLLPVAVRRGLYLVVQEALVNARRHAGAREVTVRMSRRNGSVRLRVHSDGRGFDPRAGFEKAGHYGLREMERRVKELKGALVIASHPDRPGCEITATIPLAGATHG